MPTIPNTLGGASWFSSTGWLRAGALLALVCAGCHYKIVAFGEIDPQAAERVVAEVVRIRGLRPERPIRFQRLSAAALRREIEEDLARLRAEGTLALWRKAWIRIGLLPPDADLDKAWADLYAEEPAGYYDDEKAVMRVVVRTRVRTEVGELVGLIRRRDPVYGEALAHETAHALQDQRWHLGAFGRVADEDERLARRALVEGDASKVGFAYGALFFSSFGSFSAFVEARLASAAAQDRTPAWLRTSFQFPYVEGGLFVEKLHKSGGWAAVNAAYARPPRSTEQILHPEKYLADRPDEPRPVARQIAPPEGWKRIYGMTLGELGTGLLVGREAARGWGGDFAAVWEDGRGALALVLATCWDDEAAAARFEAATRARAAGASEPVRIERRAERVAIVRGLAGPAAETAVQAALAAP